MAVLKRVMYAAGVIALAGIAAIGYARTNECLSSVARNNFVGYHNTPEGSATIARTLSQLEAQAEQSGNSSRIANLKHNLSINTQVPVSTLCRTAAFLSREGIDDTVDEFSLGYERI